jgi:hypothetical protein
MTTDRISLLLMTMLTLTLNPATTHAERPGLLYDDFNDPRWNVVVEGSVLEILEKRKRLEIFLPADATESPSTGTFSGNHVSVCKLRGDFDLRVQYLLLEFPAFNGVRVGMGVAESVIPQISPAAVERTSFSSHDVFPPGEVYLTDFGGDISIVPSTDTRGRLRLVRNGDLLTGYFFDAQASRWQAIGSTTYTTNDVVFSVAAWSHDYAFDDQDVRVAFDNVNVVRGSLHGECKPGIHPHPIKPG